MRQSHGDRTMIVRPPYDLAFLSQLVSLSYAVFLFYTFEVQSQLKMISCTRLVNESLFAAPGSHDQDGRHAHIW